MKIVVLAGGISSERDVSLSSGNMIYQALRKKHQVIMLDVYLGYEEDSIEGIFEKETKWADRLGKVGEVNPDIEQVKALRKGKDTGFFGPHVIEICQKADIVFLALHGESGENGKIQATFDLLGIRYTGTDYLSSALAMNKALAKELFAFHKIPTPIGVKINKGEDTTRRVPLPCVVKTCCGGSSVGVYLVHTEEEYEKAVKEAFLLEEEIIVEEYIKGREFSVGVIEGKALPVIEIAPKEGFYDYKNKYQAGSTIETCPAELEDEITRRMQTIAEQVFQALRLRTYARMDFMVRGNEIFCLEANTLPGMTPTSLLPQEAQAIGVSFEELCQWIIRVSMNTV